jgi:hypothetical protein
VVIKGHYKDKCPKPLKSTTDKKEKDGSAHAAVESDSESEGAFAAADIDGYASDDGMPNLASVSESSVDDSEQRENVEYEDGDWFSEVSDDSMPELRTASESSVDDSERGEDVEGGEGNWFSDIGDDDCESPWGDSCSKEVSWDGMSEHGSYSLSDKHSEAEDFPDVAAHVSDSNDANHSPCTEVYDSGCTKHISPYHDDL